MDIFEGTEQIQQLMGDQIGFLDIGQHPGTLDILIGEPCLVVWHGSQCMRVRCFHCQGLASRPDESAG